MEEAVNVPADPVARALVESMMAGTEYVPADLLAIVAAGPKAASALNDLDRSNAQFEALGRDLGFLRTGRITQNPPSAEEQERLTALLRWLRREFKEWNEAVDKDCRKLAAMLVVAAYCSQNGKFWPEFAASSNANTAIAAVLQGRIASLQVTLSGSDLSRTPFSDKNILDRFNEADRAGGWAVIASDWPRLGNMLFADTFLSQCVCYLHAFAQDTLRLATEQLRQTTPVMLVLSSLSVADCLALAIASTNPYVRFGAILRLLQPGRRRDGSIGQTEENLLIKLLKSIATDSFQWQQWMLALNRYPVRYPQIQRALGQALAYVPDAALQPYINAIELTTMGNGRATIAECLRAFRSVASLDRRKALWSLAHERWSGWGFGQPEQAAGLMEIGYSELDYAVVGYAVECISPKERDEKCAGVLAELESMDEAWHESATDFIQTVNHILSLFQPYAYARLLGTDDDWLMEGRRILPFDPQTDRYKAMFYMMRR